jgi:hypothetical protein
MGFSEKEGTAPHHELNAIHEKVLSRSYKTLEEWRNDIRELRNSCLYSCTCLIAQEIIRFCEKEYKKFVTTFTSSDWKETYASTLKRLQERMNQIPPEFRLLGEVHTVLHECQAYFPEDSWPFPVCQQPPLRSDPEPESSAGFSPLEPTWTFIEDKSEMPIEDEDFIEFRDHFKALDAQLERERERERERAYERRVAQCAQTPEPPANKPTAKETSLANSESPPSVPARPRIRLSMGDRVPCPSLVTLEPPTVPEIPPKVHIDKSRARGAVENDADETQSTGNVVSEKEIRNFMKALHDPIAQSMKNDLCFIIESMEPQYQNHDTKLSVDVTGQGGDTLRALIDFTLSKFKERRKPYPCE